LTFQDIIVQLNKQIIISIIINDYYNVKYYIGDIIR